MRTGICYLIGAGPGDPGLITLKGLSCLQQADVVYYDSLASEQLLREAPSTAECICVGKRARRPSTSQEEINQQLCDAVRSGKTVVRLKGGDPFVFGRGGEEAIALTESGLKFEVVPGVTSGIGAPAYAGIPVTHRGVATAVTLVTGHETPEKPFSQTDWHALAQCKHTLSIYMGLGQLASLSQKLIDGGRPESEAVAVIQSGTTSEQRTVVATLKSIGEAVRDAGLRSPALVVVGDVVGLRSQCSWQETRSLSGKRIAVTRPKHQFEALAQPLRELGAEVLSFPTIEIVPIKEQFAEGLVEAISLRRLPCDELLAESDSLSAALVRTMLEPPAWVVFTSTNGVHQTWERLKLLGLDSRVFGKCRIAAVGRGTAEALEAYCISADLIPEKSVAECLFAELNRAEGSCLKDKHILVLRAERARPVLAGLLRDAGAKADDIAVYQTVCASDISPESVTAMIESPPDAITFTSASTVTCFAELLDEKCAELMKNEEAPALMSIGPITSNALRELGLPIAGEASEHSIPGLIMLLEKYLKDGTTRHQRER